MRRRLLPRCPAIYSGALNLYLLINEYVKHSKPKPHPPTPPQAVYAKVVVKEPGLSMATKLSELDLDYQRRFPGVVIPDAYPRLLLEAIHGDQQHFVRRDELRAAWAAFDPLLKALDAQAGGGEGGGGEDGENPAAAKMKIPVHAYPAGSRGPPEADALLARVGYVRPAEYHWRAAGAVQGVERP